MGEKVCRPKSALRHINIRKLYLLCGSILNFLKNNSIYQPRSQGDRTLRTRLGIYLNLFTFYYRHPPKKTVPSRLRVSIKLNFDTNNVDALAKESPLAIESQTCFDAQKQPRHLKWFKTGKSFWHNFDSDVVLPLTEWCAKYTSLCRYKRVFR